MRSGGCATGDEAMRAEFFPGLAKADLFARGYVSRGRSGHSRGSWWHYSLVNEPHPGTYFDFPVARAALR